MARRKPASPPSAPHSRRARLLAGSALCGATLMFAVAAAQAQSLPGVPAAADIKISAGGAQPVITAPDANTLDVDLNAARTVINWASFHVGGSDKVTFHFEAGSDIVLNKSPTQVKVDAGGQVAGMVGGATGGNIWFYSPQGVMISPGAVMTAGNFVFARGDAIVDMDFIDAAAPLDFLRSVSDSLIQIDTISSATTASINASGDLVLSAASGDLIATTVLAAGTATVSTDDGAISIGEVTAGGAASVTAAGGDLTLGELDARGDATATGSGAVSVTDASSGSGDIVLTAGAGASLGAATADRDITVSGVSASLGSGTAGRDISVTATTGPASVTGAVSAGDDVEVTATTGDVMATGSLTSTGASAGGGDAHVLARSTGGAVTVGSATTQGTGGGGAGDVTLEAATTASLTTGASTQDIVISGASASLGSGTATRDVLVTATTSAASVTGSVTAGDDIELTATSGSVTAGDAVLTSTGADADSDAHVLARSTGGSVTVGSATTQGSGSGRGDVAVEGATTAALTAGQSTGDIKVTGTSASLGSGSATGDVLVTATTGVASVTGSVTAGDDIELTATSGSVMASSASLTATGSDANADAHVLARSTGGAAVVGSAATQGTGTARGDITVEGATTASIESAQSSRHLSVAATTASLGSATVGGDLSVTATTGPASVTGAVTAGDDIEITATSGSVMAAGGSLTSTGIAAGDETRVLVRSTGGSVTVGSAATQGTGASLGDVRIEGATSATLGAGGSTRDIFVLGPAASLGSATAARDVFVTATTGAASVTGAVSAGDDVEVTSSAGDVAAAGGSLISTGAGADGGAHVLARSTTGAVTVGSAATQGASGSFGDVTIEAATTASLGSVASSRDVTVTGPSASLASGTASRDVFVTATTGVASVTGSVSAGDDIEITATGAVAAGTGSLTATGAGVSDDAHVLLRSTGGAVTAGSATTQGAGAARGDVTVDAATTATVNGALQSTQDVVLQAGTTVAAGGSTIVAGRDITAQSNGAVTLGTASAGDDIALRALSGRIAATGDLRAGTTQTTQDLSGAADALVGATLTGHDVDIRAQTVAITGGVAAGRTADGGETLDAAQLASDVRIAVTNADPGAAALRVATGGGKAVTAHQDVVLTGENAAGASTQTGDVFAGRDVAVHSAAADITMRSARAGDDVVLRAPGGMIEVSGDVQAGRDRAGAATTDAAGAGDDLNTALPFQDFDGNPGTVFAVVGFDVSIVAQAVRVTGATAAGRQPSTDAPDTAGPVDSTTSDVRIQTRLSGTPVSGLAPNIELGAVTATRDLQIDSAKAVITGDLKAGRDIAVLGRGGVTPGAAPDDHSGSGVTIASAHAGDDALAFSVYGRTHILGGVTSGAPFQRLVPTNDRNIDGATEAADQLAIYLRYFDLDDASNPYVLPGGVIHIAGQGVTVGGNMAAQGAGSDVRLRSSLDIDVSGSTTAGRFASFQTDAMGGGALTVGAVTAGQDVMLDGVGVQSTGVLSSTSSDVAVRSRGGGAITLAGASAGDDVVLRTTGQVTVTGAVTTGGAGDSAGLGDALRVSDGTVTLEGQVYDLTGHDIDITGASIITSGTMTAGGTGSDVRVQSAGAISLGNATAARDVLVDGGSTVSTGALGAGRDVGVRSTGAGATVTVGGATAGDDVVVRALGAITITGALASAGGGADSAATDQAGDLMFDVAGSGLGGDFDLAGRMIDVRTSAGAILATASVNAATDARFQTGAGAGGSVTVAAVTAGRDVLLDGFGAEASGTLTATSGDVAVRARDGGAIILAGVSAGDDLVVRTSGSATLGGAVATGGGTDGPGLGDTLRTLEGAITLEGVTYDLTGADIDIVAGAVTGAGALTAVGGAADIRIRSVGAIGFGNATAGRDVLVDGASTVLTGVLAAGRDVAVRSTGDGAAVTVGGATAGDDVVIRAKGAITVTGALASADGGVDSSDADQAGDLMFAASRSSLGADFDLVGRMIDLRSTAGSIVVDGAVNAATDARFQTASGTGGSVTVAAVSAGRDVLLDGSAAEATGMLTSVGDVAVRARVGGAITLAAVLAGDDLVLRTSGSVTLGGIVGAGAGTDTSGLGDTLRILEGAFTLEGLAYDLTGGDIDIAGGTVTAVDSLTATGAASDIRVRAAGAINLADATAGRDVLVDGAAAVTTGILNAGRDVGVRSTGDGATVTVGGATAGDDVVIRAKGAINVTGALNAGGGVDSADAEQAGDLLFAAASSRLAADLNLVGRTVDLRSSAGSIEVTGAVTAATDARFQTQGITGGSVKVAAVTAGRDILLDGGGPASGAGAWATGTLMATGGDVAVRARDGSGIRLVGVTARDDVALRSTGTIMGAGTVETTGGPSAYGLADRLTDGTEGGRLTVGGMSFDLTSSDIDVVGGLVNILRTSARGSARIRAGNVSLNGGAAVGVDILIDSDASLTVGDLSATGDIALRSRTGSLTVGRLTAGDDIVLRAAQGIFAGPLKASGLERIGVGDQLFASDASSLGSPFSLIGATIDLKSSGGGISMSGAEASGDVRLQALGGDVNISGVTTAGRDIFADGASVNATGSLNATGDVALQGRTGGVTVGSVSAGDDIIIRAAGDVMSTGELKSGQNADTAGVGDRLLTMTGAAGVFGTSPGATGGVIDIGGAGIRLSGPIRAAGADAHLRLRSTGGITLGDATLSGDIAIDSAGDVVAGVLDAGRDLAVRSTGGGIMIGAGTAGDDIVLRAARSISVQGALEAGQGAEAGGLGDTLFALDPTNLGGDFDLADGNVDIAADAVTAGRVAAAGDARIRATGRVDASDVEAGRDVLLDGRSVNAGALKAARDIAVRATGGALDLGSATAGDDLVLRANGAITTTGALNAGGGADGVGAGERLLATAGEAFDLAGRNVDISSAAGGVAIQGSVTATDDIRLEADATVATTGGLQAGRDVRLQGGAGLAVAGDVKAGRDAALQATGAIATTGDVEAGRDVELLGASISSGALRAGRDVAVRSETGSISLGSVSAGDDVALRAAQDVSVSGAITAQGGADGEGAADTLFASDPTAMAGDFDLSGANIDVRAKGGITMAGAATAGRDARFQTVGAGAVNLGAVAAGGDVLADGGDVRASGSLSAGRDVAVRARTGAVDLASASAGDDIAIRAAQAIKVSGALASGSGANALGAADRLIAPGEGGAIVRLVDPLASTPAVEGFALSGGDIDIKGGADVSLGGDLSAGNIRLQAATKLSLAGATAGDTIFARMADLSLNGAWRANSVRLEVTASRLSLGEDAVGSGGLALSSEQLGRIDAPTLQIFLGDTSGDQRGGDLAIGTLSIDTAKIRNSLELYAGALSDVTITGAFAPMSGGANATTVRIGAPDAAGGWTPRSIKVVADGGGSIGYALTTGGRSFTDVRAFGSVELNAKGDILMGYQDYIDRLAVTSAASVPGAVKSLIAPQTANGPRILIAAGSLTLRADGKVAQQDTGGLLGTTPTGLYLLGGSGAAPQLLLGRTTRGASGLPEFIELNGALTSGSTIMTGESVSLTSGIAFDTGVSPSAYYRLNTCAILQQGSCMPSNGHPTISIPPEQLTGLTLEDGTSAAGAADPTVASATNEEVWKDSN